MRPVSAFRKGHQFAVFVDTWKDQTEHFSASRTWFSRRCQFLRILEIRVSNIQRECMNVSYLPSLVIFLEVKFDFAFPSEIPNRIWFGQFCFLSILLLLWIWNCCALSLTLSLLTRSQPVAEPLKGTLRCTLHRHSSQLQHLRWAETSTVDSSLNSQVQYAALQLAAGCCKSFRINRHFSRLVLIFCKSRVALKIEALETTKPREESASGLTDSVLKFYLGKKAVSTFHFHFHISSLGRLGKS